MSWDFHVGQKVVCVDDDPRRVRSFPLKKGAVYTVAEVGHAFDRLFIDLVEVPRRSTWGPGWRADRFRPLRERKTDISIFTAMLNPVRERADA